LTEYAGVGVLGGVDVGVWIRIRLDVVRSEHRERSNSGDFRHCCFCTVMKIGAAAYVLEKEESFIRKNLRKADIVAW
jgi:hypothetical protein